MAKQIELTFQMKDFFFDRKVIERQVNREKRRSMSRSLAFIRTKARSLLRRRKRSSSPGSPPSVHSKDPTASLKKILFAYDMATGGGVVGPVKINRSNPEFRSSEPVPSIMESGGSVLIRRGKKSRGRRVTYAARPFMQPALDHEIEQGNVIAPWSNVVSG